MAAVPTTVGQVPRVAHGGDPWSWPSTPRPLPARPWRSTRTVTPWPRRDRHSSKASPEPGWQEQDPEAWWQGTCEALRRLMSQVPAEDVVALGVTHQRETFACFDEADRPLRPAILWLDTRAVDQVRRLGSPEVHRLSGKPPSTTPSLYKLAWLADHEPEVLRRAVMVADVHAFLVRRLTGRLGDELGQRGPAGPRRPAHVHVRALAARPRRPRGGAAADARGPGTDRG